MGVWTLCIDAWVIQDGNYEDFVIGRRHDFEVEALPHSVEHRDTVDEPRLGRAEDGRHAFSGAVLKFAAHGAWVIDFGVHCYGKAPLPEGVLVGDALAGEVSFFPGYPAVYDEAFDAEAPLRTYSWRVERIRLETTPWVEVAPGSVQRDPTKISYVDVRATDAWEDDGGRASYLLDCTLLGTRGRAWLAGDHLRRTIRRRVPPRARSLSTARNRHPSAGRFGARRDRTARRTGAKAQGTFQTGAADRCRRRASCPGATVIDQLP